jgi:hypothetical protein
MKLRDLESTLGAFQNIINMLDKFYPLFIGAFRALDIRYTGGQGACI